MVSQVDGNMQHAYIDERSACLRALEEAGKVNSSLIKSSRLLVTLGAYFTQGRELDRAVRAELPRGGGDDLSSALVANHI